MQTITNVPRRAAVLGLLAAALAGCSAKEERVPVYATRGVLTYNGQPATGAVVTLHPLPLDKNTFRTVKPAGKVKPDGSFELDSRGPADGSRTGEFAVTVLWTGEAGGIGPDLLKERHSNPANPVAIVTIQAGRNEIPPIALTGPDIAPKGAAGGPAGGPTGPGPKK